MHGHRKVKPTVEPTQASHTIDFVVFGAHCSSDGSPECRFHHRTTFDNDYTRDAYVRALQTIERHEQDPHWGPSVSDAAIIKIPYEVTLLVDRVKQFAPDASAVLTIQTCHDGKIVYQRSIRFPNVTDAGPLQEQLRTVLPDVEKEKGRPIASYFMDAK